MDDVFQKTPETLRLGVVGCGQVFQRHHLPAVKRSGAWQLVAACDDSEQRLEWVRKSVPGLSVFKSFPALLESSGLDAVLIATPPESHHEVAVQALGKGLHVLVEKPMALGLSEGYSMLDESLRAQKLLWVGFTKRFRRPYMDLKRRLALVPADEIRDIRFLCYGGHRESFTRYVGDDARGGGVLDDLASHQVDLLAWLIGQPVKEVRARPLSKKEGVSTCVRYELRFENDMIAYCEAMRNQAYLEMLHVRLQDRILTADPTGVFESHRVPPKWISSYCKIRANAHFALGKLTRRPSVTAHSFEAQLRCFAAAIRNEESPTVGADGRCGVRVLEAIRACRESLRSGGAWKSLPEGARIA